MTCSQEVSRTAGESLRILSFLIREEVFLPILIRHNKKQSDVEGSSGYLASYCQHRLKEIRTGKLCGKHFLFFLDGLEMRP